MAPVLQMVNRVADEVGKEFPGKLIETLAYQWTRKPPKTIRPRQNVVIRLCTIECCFSHPLASCDSPENRAFVEDLRAWSRIAPRIWIWNYVTSFSHYFVPFPDLRARDDNLRLFAENHVSGVFQQDVYTTPSGELSDLSAWLNARLLWNPALEEDVLIDEFLDGVYGAAAPYIREYIDLLHDEVERNNHHITIWQGPDALYLSDEVLARSDSLWDAAERAAADSSAILDRVQTARLSEDYAVIWRERTRGDALLIDQEKLRLTVNPAFTTRLDRFCENARRAGVVRLKEYGTTIDEFRSGVEEQVRPRTLVMQAPVQPGSVTPGLIRRLYKGPFRRMPAVDKQRPYAVAATDRFELPSTPPDTSYAATFTGYIEIPRDGVYTFWTRSADGSMLSVGGEKAVDNGGNHAIHVRMGHTALKAGLHPITVTWYSRGKYTALEVFYRGPGTEQQEVPGAALFH
jgi:hypothetical protein